MKKYLSIKEMLILAKYIMVEQCQSKCANCKWNKIIHNNKSICELHTKLYVEYVKWEERNDN